MCRIYSLLLFAIYSITIFSQTAREEIFSEPMYAGSNYYAYPRVVNEKVTPAPKGYVPFYISSYARHGSRWLCSKKEYEEPREVLDRAHECGMLTPEGERVREIVDSLSLLATDRWGELTPRGASQHRGIAQRMIAHYPEVFAGKTWINARSTPVVRCILSMMNAVGELQKANSEISVNSDASYSDMYYLNDAFSKRAKKLRYTKEANDSVKAFRMRHTPTERLMSVLFKDRGYVHDSIDATHFVHRLFVLAVAMQNIDPSWDLLRLFTPEERYALWQVRNYRWYVQFANSPVTHHLMPFTQTHLLKNIIFTADTCLQQAHPGATLRFGHEVCVMPLACLMELDTCNVSYDHSDSLHKVFRNYKIYPMASNIQLVFYRAKGRPILVKVMLNEREVHLPIPTKQFPFYDWAALRTYYMDKLQRHADAVR